MIENVVLNENHGQEESPLPLYQALDQTLALRRSCRSFRPDPVPPAILDAILHTAQKTASWNNMQPWNVIITAGEGTDRFRTRMLELAGRQIGTGGNASSLGRTQADFAFPREYPEPYLSRRRASGYQLYAAVGIARGDLAAYARQGLENYRFFNAPHVAIISTDEALGVYGAVDCGAYVANFMSAACTLGVASIAQAALAVYSADIRHYFGLGASQRIVCGISFGFADMDHPLNNYRTTRDPVARMVTIIDK